MKKKIPIQYFVQLNCLFVALYSFVTFRFVCFLLCIQLILGKFVRYEGKGPPLVLVDLKAYRWRTLGMLTVIVA